MIGRVRNGKGFVRMSTGGRKAVISCDSRVVFPRKDTDTV